MEFLHSFLRWHFVGGDTVGGIAKCWRFLRLAFLSLLSVIILLLSLVIWQQILYIQICCSVLPSIQGQLQFHKHQENQGSCNNKWKNLVVFFKTVEAMIFHFYKSLHSPRPLMIYCNELIKLSENSNQLTKKLLVVKGSSVNDSYR